jgi:hypothetical protein
LIRNAVFPLESSTKDAREFVANTPYQIRNAIEIWVAEKKTLEHTKELLFEVATGLTREWQFEPLLHFIQQSLSITLPYDSSCKQD